MGEMRSHSGSSSAGSPALRQSTEGELARAKPIPERFWEWEQEIHQLTRLLLRRWSFHWARRKAERRGMYYFIKGLMECHEESDAAPPFKGLDTDGYSHMTIATSGIFSVEQCGGSSTTVQPSSHERRELRLAAHSVFIGQNSDGASGHAHVKCNITDLHTFVDSTFQREWRQNDVSSVRCPVGKVVRGS